MRRLLAVSATAALLLAGCASGDEPTASSSATDEATATAEQTLSSVAVEGEQGSAPEVTFPTPFEVSDAVAAVVTAGNGATLVEGQKLTLDYVALNGTDGSQLQSTYETGTPETMVLGDAGYVPVLNEALTDQQVGVRVLLVVPANDYNDYAVLMAIEVTAAEDLPATLDRAAGLAVDPVEGLPTVTLAADGAPSIEIPDAEAPTELVAQPLIVGEGATVASGQTVVVHYTGWTWDGEQFDSSWDSGSTFSQQIGAGLLIQGWDQGLVGQTVGSQVLLIIPPDLGYGASTGHALAEDTLVFVVDILNAY